MNVKKSKAVISLLTIVFVTGAFSLARANSTYSGYFNSAYTGSSLAGPGNCAVCHTSVPNLNPFGSDFKNHGKNQAALTTIEPLDSDGDGSTNKVEINAGTLPGDPNSHPVVSDTKAPVVTGFSIPATSASLTVSISTFTATDNIAVNGYLVTESATAPSASAAGWSPSAPVSYTFSTAGAKTLYAWAEDAAGNISTSRSASVNVTLPSTSDAIAPTVTGFSIPATSASLTVSITTFTATDNVGVNGYRVTESAAAPSASATGWSASAPSGYTFTTSGAKTLYAWAKDAAGNVSSSLSANVTVTASVPQPPAEGLAIWSGQWLKVTIKYDGYSLGLSTAGLVQQNPTPSEEEDTSTLMNRDRENYVAYLRIISWDSQQNSLQSELYQQNSSNQWVYAPLTLRFIDGTPTDFLSWAQVNGDFTAGFTARIKGKETAGTLKSGSFKTLGGYYFEIDSTANGSGSSSQAFAGGQISINGNLVSRTKVPVPDGALAQIGLDHFVR